MNRKWQRGRRGDSQFREFSWGAEKAAKTGANAEGTEQRGEKSEEAKKEVME